MKSLIIDVPMTGHYTREMSVIIEVITTGRLAEMPFVSLALDKRYLKFRVSDRMLVLTANNALLFDCQICVNICVTKVADECMAMGRTN